MIPKSIYTGWCLQMFQRQDRNYTREKNKQGKFGAHEQDVSQGPVGFENAQMTAQIGPLPDKIFILFTDHATRVCVGGDYVLIKPKLMD